MDAIVKTGQAESGRETPPGQTVPAAKSDFYFRPDPYVAGLASQVEELLEELIKSELGLMDVIGRHMLFGYAKRLRPIFVLLSHQLFQEEVSITAVECGAASELIHSASLFHDDVIDGAKTRKGRRAANAVWGNKSAVIMGDHFFVIAYNLIAKLRDFQLLEYFVETCGSLADGVMLEIKNTGNLTIEEETHSEIITKKTADFFKYGALIGGYISGASAKDMENLAGLGLNFGLSFQHSDDLLDLFADPDATGKPRGSDLRAELYTTPIIHALSTNSSFAEKYTPILKGDELSDTDIEEIADILRADGSFDYVKGLVRNYGEIALGYLEKLPEGRANESLRTLVMRIVNREY